MVSAKITEKALTSMPKAEVLELYASLHSDLLTSTGTLHNKQDNQPLL
jgi:hypothetical protein